MKQTTVNEFKDGLNLDLHPLVTPKTVLTDNINGTFITYNGNEFCLQNDRGNEKVTSLTPGYTPIGIKEHNGVLYIVSVNGNGTEIGTFPSPNYPEYNSEYDYDVENVYDLNLNKYEALHVLEDRTPLTGINFGYTIKTPVTIEIQDSYDGSVNLILVTDGHKPRIINSGFSVLPNNKYKFVNRNQSVETNIYDDINKESELIRTSEILTNIQLLGVKKGGQFKGGNYTFYIKFGDADFNKTDIVAESGIVSVFNGNNGVASTISGTLLDERTDKMVGLNIYGLNPIYSKLYVYFTREYSDTQGLRMTEAGMFREPIDMKQNVVSQDIWLTGFEQIVPVDIEELNVDYHTIDWARAEAQHSNMLFLGNVGQKETFELYRELDNITKQVTVNVAQTSLPSVSTFYDGGTEYYDVQNIYNRVGYYPGEIYRFGIVYILKDGSKTPVFNMNGKNFQTGQTIQDGVFLMPDVDVIYNDVVKPIYLTFTLPQITNDNVLGWFVVRQKRIPNTICEGLNIAIDRTSNIPVIWDGQNWITQSFLDAERGEILANAYGTKTQEWQKARDVQLKYHNFNLSNSVINEEAFQNWLNENGFTYHNNYWVSVLRTNEAYSLNSAIPESGTLKSKLEYATRNIADQYKATHEEAANWNYTKVFTVFTDTDDQQTAATEILNNLSNGTSYRMIWLRQYNYGGTNEFNTPIDNPSDNYAIVLYTPGNSIDYESNTITNDTSYNSTLRNNWKRVFSLETGSLDTMRRKKLKEWRCIDYWKEANALLSLDPCVNQSVASILDGSKFNIRLEREVAVDPNQDILYRQEISNTDSAFNLNDTKCIFIPSDTAAKVIDGYEFSNVAGNGSAADKFKYFTFPDGVFEPHPEHHDGRSEHFYKLIEEIDNPDVSTLTSTQEEWLYELYRTNLNINLIKGLFTPYIGLANKDRIPNGIYSIKHKSYLDSNDFIVRQQDQSEYYTVSKYLNLDETQVNVFRGDCFTNTITMRIIRSFIDNSAPVSDVVVDPDGWAKWVINKDINSVNLDAAWDDRTGPVRYDQVNTADVNTVDLGLWVTFKCLSSYNLGLRSLNPFHVDEMSLMGSPRTFHPLNTVSTSTGYKMEESFLLNDGLSATVGRKRYNLMPDVPYSKSEFANRIMFSNVNITDAFTNGYRTFQGLAYKDYDKQYGAITKLIPFGQNIFVVMEHGLGLIPVNPKALMQTTTGEAIHIYGYGVLPDEMTIISQDYGSKYEHSVIRTPIGIYGMDVDAKKIWRFSDKQGFETISDMKIETYLNDYLKEIPVEIGIKDVRAHYNGKKGDVMFSFYDESDSIKTVGIVGYFNVPRRKLTLEVDQHKDIVCGTNLSDSEIELTNSDNIECSYSNKTLHITALTEGDGNIIINGITIEVNITPKVESSISDSSEIEIEYDPDISWYVPSSSENKNIYFDIRKIDTFYGMRFSLPVFLKCPNGRPTSSNFSAVYAIDKTGVLSVESENKSIIDVPKDNHVADNRLYNQCDGYTWPTIVHVSEKCFKDTGTVGIRIYNKDKTEYDTCIVNVLNTNPEGVSYSQFEQKNLLWPFNIYVNANGCFDVWYHHHLRHNQIINIDDPTAIWSIENGYSLQDGVKTNGTNIKLLYCSKQFKAGNKPGTYHITFTCPKTQYYDYSGTYTVTVHVLDPNGPASSEIPSSSIGQIEIQPKELDLYVGQKSNIKVVDKDSGSVINNVTWSTSQSAPFTKYGNTVTAIREGTGYLIATAKNGMVNDKATIRCTYDVGQSIQIPSKNIEMSSYSEEPMDVTIVCEHCTIEQVSSSLVTWTSSNSKIAEVIWKNKKPTICSYGAGQAILTGKYLGQNDVSITCTVTVVETEPEPEVNFGERSRTIDSIGVTEPGGPVVYMTPGSTKVFKTLGNYMMGKDDYPAHWSISENSDNVISFASEPSVGDLQVAVNANALGTAKLNLEFKAVDREYIKTSYTWTIHVVENIVLSRQVVISPSSLTMLKGEKAKVKATVFPENATYKTIVWDTPQGAVVSCTESGEVTAVNVGSSRLIATAADDNSASWITTTVIDKMTGGAEGIDFEDWNWIE